MRLLFLTLLLIAVPLLWDANSEPLEPTGATDTLLTIQIRPKTDAVLTGLPLASGTLLPGETIQLKTIRNQH